jgi:hypothetical protein
MKYLQFLDFEICSECNLAAKHSQCPSSHPERYSHLNTDRTLDDDTIVDIAVRAYTEFEFRGCIGWHYYNEPLLQKERIFKLIERIKAKVPSAKFLLWTNGELIGENCDELKVFDKIWITNYRKQDFSRVSKVVKHTTILNPHLDKRLTDVYADTHNNSPCVRPYAEMIIDHHGNAHICCMDWKGLASPGNVFTDDLGLIAGRMGQIRNAVAGQTMRSIAPDVCKQCNMRFQELTPVFGEEICREQAMHRDWAINWHMPVRNSAVVITSYKVPVHRLHEHFAWNNALYTHLGVKVYVVADQQYPLPAYAECVIFDQDMPKFNLARTSNFGILHAIRRGHEVVIKSDVDVCFPVETGERLVRTRDTECVVPCYLMAMNYPDRRWNYIPAPKAEGTIVMSAENWKQFNYEERCVGYGAEDGIMIHAIEKSKLPINRAHIVWHVAHIPDTPQKERGGRTDHWNRDSGFNPDALQRNIQFHPARANKRKKLKKGW